MARLPRYYIKNQPQHIIQRGFGGMDIFHHDDDYLHYYEWLQLAADQHKLKIHAYILMPDHVHLLASPGSENSISKTLQSLGRNYVQYFNNNYGHTGTLWEGRYRATVLDSKEYLLLCSRYIETNGVRNNMVKHPRDYDWSSYGHNANGVEDPLISEHRIFSALGKTGKERNKAYRALFKKRLSAEQETLIHNSTIKGWALGDSKFLAKIEKSGNRRATQLPRGRPRNYKA
ncbi:MAG: transposase [Gammaproteobacteria bacterium]|nr:transposase [Gammaproteobacteria bacterium]